MAEIFLAGVLVSFVKLMAYGDIGIGLSFVLVYVLPAAVTYFSVRRPPLAMG